MNLKSNIFSVLKKFKLNTLPFFTTKYIPLVNLNNFIIYKSIYTLEKLNLLILFEKKKLFYLYGIKYKTFKLFFKNFTHKFSTIYSFISFIYMKLDILLVTVGLCKTLKASRQLIKHKKIIINGKIINYYNFLCKKEDIIIIKNIKSLYCEQIKLNLDTNKFFRLIFNINTNTIVIINNLMLKNLLYTVNLPLLLSWMKYTI